MKVILDFDDTLYNTQKIKEDMEHTFGIRWNKKNPPSNYFQKAVPLLEDPRKYLFSDTITFLDKLKNKGHELFLLTSIAGPFWYAKKKISALSVEPFQECWLIKKEKEIFLKEKGFMDEEGIFFVNDKMSENIALEKIFPQWCFLVKRVPGIEYPSKYKNFIFCDTLTEMLPYFSL